MTEHQNPDGTTSPRDEDHDGLINVLPSQGIVGLYPGQYLDELSALQIGVAMVLAAIEATTVDRKALMEHGRVERNTLRLQRVFLDMPDTEDNMVPVPSACISALAQDLNLSGPLSGQALIEDSLDTYGEGTILQRLYETQCDLQVVLWFSHKDDRAGYRKALIEAFNEPDSEFSGRIVTIPEYFDRPAEMYLQSIEYPDTPESAQAKEVVLQARVRGTIQAVKLVPAPAEMRLPRVQVAVTSGA